jgi:Protein of unknown function (DUF4240)
VSDFRPMDIDRFWELIEQARATAGPAADQAVRDYDDPDDDPDRDYWQFDDEEFQRALSIGVDDLNASTRGAAEVHDNADDEADDDDFDDDDDLGDDLDDDFDDEDDITDPVARALLDLLMQLPAAEIAAFDNLFEDLRAGLERDDVANAAVLIEHGFLGDDSFDDFRAGVVALGRSAFEAAVADPDSLAGHPLVREIAAANDPRWLGREDMLFVASHAYSAVTGEDEVSFYDFAEGLRADADGDDETGDGEQTAEPDDQWDVSDEAETRRRLPRLADLFYERSLRNRQRALENLGLQN